MNRGWRVTPEAEALRQILVKMDEAAEATAKVAVQLAHDLEEAKELASEDRRQIARLILLTKRLTEQGEDTLHKTESLQETAVHVAEDLAASIERADEAPADLPGAGADAALRSPGPTSAQIAEAANKVVAELG